MEIITYVLSGSLEHKDSMGNGRVIRAGDFQYMAAGTGVQHSEHNPSSEEEVHFLQVWIQPDHLGTAPRYAELSLKEAGAGPLHLVTSKTGREGSIAINQEADLWLGVLENGHVVNHQLKKERQAWLQVAEGTVLFKGNKLETGDAAAISLEETLTFQSEGKSKILLFDLA
jgi:quercetin 2,3-dioxygenase